ncbi:MAG: hypothetical protein ABDH28_05050 [Brevinematia bacterium]
MRKVLGLVVLTFFAGVLVVEGIAQDVVVRDSKPEEWGILATSPVTGVQFKVRKDTKVAEYRGKVYFFDARKDLEMFLANPRKYAGPFVVRRTVTGAEIGKFVVSPISGKIFVASPNIISVEYEGKIFYLLSETEYQLFEQNPDKYYPLSVDVVVITNFIVRTNCVVSYIIVTNVQTNVQLVNELVLITNYIIRTNIGAVEQQKVVVVREEPKVVAVPEQKVVVVPEQKGKVVTVEVHKPEKVTTVVIDLEDEKKLIKFQRVRKGEVIIVRGPHHKEMGKVAVSPVDGNEFVITSTSFVIRVGKKLYYVKSEAELNLFLDNFDKYAR